MKIRVQFLGRVEKREQSYSVSQRVTCDVNSYSIRLNRGIQVSIKSQIFKLFADQGYENVNNEQAFEVAKKEKPDTKWNITHLYYWKKVWKQLLKEGKVVNGPISTPTSKKTKVKKGKKTTSV